MSAYEAIRTTEDGVVQTTPANLVANRIFIRKNTPYGFDDRPFMVDIFDDPHRYVLMKTARQVSKSTWEAARILTNTEAYAPYSVLYLSPSFAQTSKFSHDRLGPTIKESPHLHVRMDKDCLDNVLEKEFVDGSLIYLSYAKDNADRVRGITVDEILYDEIQDMQLGPIETVTRESLFTSRHKKRAYSGTPKSLSNGIEQLWRKSDQREWMVRCRKHGSRPHHQKLTLKNIGTKGVICEKCGGPLNTLDGLWVRTSTRTEEGRDPHVHGYHIPQIIFPTTTSPLGNGKFGFLDWGEFLLDIQNGDEATVLNEKFGESADSAEKPITEDQLRALCVASKTMPMAADDSMTGEYLFAGVDWGAGIKSSTALVIGQFDPKNPKKFKFVFMRRYHKGDANPEYCVPEILRICQLFRVKRLHADWGSGLGINSRIEALMGEDYLTTNYWSSSIGGKNVAFDSNLSRFVINRSVTMTRFFEAMKRGGMEVAFSWDEYKPFSRDITAVFREERKNGDPYYDHNPEEMDDFCHAMIYCWLVSSWMKYSENFVDTARKSPGSLHNPSLTT